MFRNILYLWLGFLCLLHAEEEAYRLQPGDVVNLAVFQEEDLTKEVKIDRAGSASFHLIGNVKLSGLTVSEAEKKLIKLYEADYLVSAQLSLAVLGHAEKSVIVVGDIASPGSVELGKHAEMKLQSALTRAGGVLQGSRQGKVIVERANGELETHRLSKIDGVSLQHGDMVTVRLDVIVEKVQKVATITVSGLVNRPGSVVLPPSGELDIITAIASAGDFSRLANKNNLTVRRISNGSYTTIPLKMKNIQSGKDPMFMMKEGDIVIVKERTW